MKNKINIQKFLGIALISLLTLGLMTLSSQSSVAQTVQTPGKSSVNPKIDSVLAEVLQIAQSNGGVSSQAVQQVASRAGIQVQNNAIKVVLETNSSASFLVGAVSALSGGTVTGQSRNYIELSIPLSNGPLTALITIASLTGIAYIRPPLSPQALAVSEGVNVSGASNFHTNGFNGQGVKIAVIDLGFAGLGTAQALGELPINAVTFDFSGTGLQSTTAHGTAVAEIVHDMAPNAQLYLMKISDEVDLENAVDEAISQGMDIINHSVGWFNTNFYDGTGPIAANAQRARSSGILWVNAAGNYAQRHWQGLALDNNNDGWVEFSGQPGVRFSASAGQTINVFMTWNDWGTSAQDYDLFVTNTSGTIFASSERLQSGTQPPTESIFFSAPFSGTFELRVKPLDVTSPKELSIFNLNQDLSPSVTSGSVIAPADSSSSLSVGAVSHLNWTTGPIQSFSSQGPTTDGRSKPDISGPDAVSTSQGQFSPFAGTSAAAPHVAGAAALLLSENPSLNANSLESKLKGDAIPMGSPNQFGSGRLNLVGQPTGRPDLTINNPTFLPGNPQVGSNLTISAQVSNQGTVASGAFIVQLSDSFGNLTENLISLNAGGSTSVNFNRGLLQPSETYTLTVDPFNQVTESNETNNSAQLTVSAQQQQLPDLLVTNISVSPQNPAVGGFVNYDVDISNQGSAAAGFFTIQLSDSQGSTQLNLSGLAAGGSSRLTFQRQFLVTPENVFVSVDPFGQVGELDENNNTFTIQVLAGGGGGPQIGIDINTDRAIYNIGETAQVTFTLDADAYVRVYVVNAQGAVSTLYPSNGAGFLSAGNYNVGQLINSSLTVSLPAGIKHIHAIATSSQISFGIGNNQSIQWTNPTTFQLELISRMQSQDPFTDFDFDFEAIQALSGPSLSIDINTDRSSYSIGDPISVSFTTTGGGFVRLYDVDPTGLVSTLFPLSGNGSGFLSAGTYNVSQLISSALQVVGPSGTETIHAAITSSQVSFGVGGAQNPSYATASNFQAVLAGRIQSLAPGAESDLDFASFQVGGGGGPINQPPVAQFSVNPSQPTLSQSTTLDASSSFDPDGTIIDYTWTVAGNNTNSFSGPIQNINFGTIRVFTITLTVTDNLGATGTSQQFINVTAPGPVNLAPIASFTLSTTTPQVNQFVTFNGTGSTDPDGAITQYRWDIDGNGTIDSTQSSFQARYSSSGTFTVSLTVFDNSGQSNSTTQQITVGNVAPPPAPISQNGPGVFIEGVGTSQIKITVKGDPSWTQDHDYKVRLRMADANSNVFGFTSIQAQTNGNATLGTTTENSRNPILRGSVIDGNIVYTVGVNRPAAVWFDIEFNLAFNDGLLNRGAHEVPIFVLISGQAHRVEPRDDIDEFSLLARNGLLLPFSTSNIVVCNQAARRCVDL
jgi:PKD repeat protein